MINLYFPRLAFSSLSPVVFPHAFPSPHSIHLGRPEGPDGARFRRPKRGEERRGNERSPKVAKWCDRDEAKIEREWPSLFSSLCLSSLVIHALSPRLSSRHLRVSFPRRVRSSLTRYTPASSPRPSVPRPLRGWWLRASEGRVEWEGRREPVETRHYYEEMVSETNEV